MLLNDSLTFCIGHYEWLRSPDEYVLSYMPLVTLDPGTTYQVRVVAKNGDGFEAAAAWLEFHTPGIGEFTGIVVNTLLPSHGGRVVTRSLSTQRTLVQLRVLAIGRD